jgi:hypothetical protein
MKVTSTTIRPTRAFGDASELAPFEALSAVPEEAGAKLDAEVVVTAGVLDVTELGEALARAALIS